MTRITYLVFPLALLFLAACADVATAPDVDMTASYARGGGKPDKPPKPGGMAKPEITFAAGTTGNRTLWVMDADGGNATAVYGGGYLMHSSWSDQGSGTPVDPFVILVSQGGSAPQSLDKLELVVDEGGPHVQNITTLADESVYFVAVVEPGGTHFAAIDGNDPLGNSLVLGDMNTGAVQFLYRPEPGQALSQPAWNTDGSTLAFFEVVANWPDCSVDLRIIDMGTGQTSTAFSFSCLTHNPQTLSWARTANEVLLDVDGMMYRVNLGAPALDDPIGEGFQAVWSPDDTRIAYVNGRIYVKTFGERRDKRLRGGTHPDWRRNP